MANDKIKVGVIGAGTMGRGIVQVFAQSGYPVAVFDAVPAALEAATAQIGKMLGRAVEKGKMSAEDAAASQGRITVVNAIGDLGKCGLVVEAATERPDVKVEILKSIPNLRKVSVSPWADIDKSVRDLGGRYVLSYKPNPAIFAEESWDPHSARAALRAALDRMKGCAVEVIMKDISTVRYQPRRLWEWCAIATEEVMRAA